jgi:hypothetical protein
MRNRPRRKGGSQRTTTRSPDESISPAGDRCRVCRADLPPGHVHCSRVCAMWDRREHLGTVTDEPVESWPR